MSILMKIFLGYIAYLAVAFPVSVFLGKFMAYCGRYDKEEQS